MPGNNFEFTNDLLPDLIVLILKKNYCRNIIHPLSAAAEIPEPISDDMPEDERKKVGYYISFLYNMKSIT